MRDTMKAAVLHGVKDVRMEERPVPSFGDKQALVAVKAVGVCGSDVHYYEHFGMSETYKLTSPQILGHEASGEVVAVGKSVKNVAPRQRVTIEPGETCFQCLECKSGHYNLCPGVEFLSTPNNKGAFCEYLVMNADMLFPIPDSMAYDTACLAEPLSVGIHACRLTNVKPGDTVLISGAGTIGLLALIDAKAFGASAVIVSDVKQNRLELAKELGADVTVNSAKEDLIAILGARANGGVDCCFECSGNPLALSASIRAVRKGGRIAMIGIPRETEVPLSVFDIIDKELNIQGIFRYTNTYPTAIDILHANEQKVQKLITGRYSLSETAQALDDALNAKDATIKNVVTVG